MVILYLRNDCLLNVRWKIKYTIPQQHRTSIHSSSWEYSSLEQDANTFLSLEYTSLAQDASTFLSVEYSSLEQDVNTFLSVEYSSLAHDVNTFLSLEYSSLAQDVNTFLSLEYSSLAQDVNTFLSVEHMGPNISNRYTRNSYVLTVTWDRPSVTVTHGIVVY